MAESADSVREPTTPRSGAESGSATAGIHNTGVTEALMAGYSLELSALRPGPVGTATSNWIATTADGAQLFVKVYPEGGDLDGEEQALALSEFAARRGVPTAALVPAADGAGLWRGAGPVVSLWRYLDDVRTAEGEVSGTMAAVIGRQVGRLHRVLASHPADRPALVEGWRVCDLERAPRLWAQVRDYYRSQPRPDAFERWAADSASKRLELMPRLARVLAGLGPVTAQVVHGDLASPNVLLDSTTVAAFIDFRPPRPRPAVWEIARLACDPRTVLSCPDWLHGLARFLTGYRAANPAVPVGELASTVAVAACAAASSTYPLAAPLEGIQLTAALRDYARDRHDASMVLLSSLDRAQEVLRGALT